MPTYMLSIEENEALLKLNDAVCIRHAGNIDLGTKWAAPAAANASWQVQAESVMVPASRSQRPVWRQKAPGRLGGWPHPASAHQHGTHLLDYDQYKHDRIKSLSSMARCKGEIWRWCTQDPCHTDHKVCVAYLQQKHFQTGQGTNRLVQSSVDRLTASWAMSFLYTVKCLYRC